MTIDIAELFARRERERDAPPRQNPKIRHRTAVQTNFIPRKVAFGRVEDGRGSLGPMANAPFPIPAHQTGRADFRHPAFRLASPQGTRRQTNRTRLRHGE